MSIYACFYYVQVSINFLELCWQINTLSVVIGIFYSGIAKIPLLSRYDKWRRWFHDYVGSRFLVLVIFKTLILCKGTILYSIAWNATIMVTVTWMHVLFGCSHELHWQKNSERPNNCSTSWSNTWVGMNLNVCHQA